MDQQQPPCTAVTDTRHVPLDKPNPGRHATVARVVPKRSAPPPQVAAFDSAM